MLNSLPSPVLIAHRGSSAHAPENTLASFLLAEIQGVKMIELDVQLTADKHLVVVHDNSVDRTTNGTGKISEMTLAEIRSLNASFSFQEQFPEERIPTLEEVFLRLNPSTLINIELKNIFHPLDELPVKVAEFIYAHKLSDRVFFSSFNPFALSRIARLLPESPRGRLLHYPLTVELHSRIQQLIQSCESVNISFQSLTVRRIEAFQKVGLKVFTYTLNRREDIIKALVSGVDGFFTDDPPLGFAVIEEWKNSE